jgi:RNA polymerase sigma-70 factor (ECF subfamily)
MTRASSKILFTAHARRARLNGLPGEPWGSSVDSEPQRLSRIATLWTVLDRAHNDTTRGATDAQRLLIQRYCGAVYRYLLGALRDEDAASDLFQEFAVRFLRGDFRGADPARGRFRDYLKRALVHLVTDHHRARMRQPRALDAEPVVAARAAVEEEDGFTVSWRKELMNQAWSALSEQSAAMHAVLLYHVENPRVESAHAARELSARLGKPMTPGNVRVSLHRARAKFVELLVREVERSLSDPAPGHVVDELRELKLLTLCAPALRRRGLIGAEEPDGDDASTR